MMSQVIFHECRNEIVAVIVAVVASQLEIDATRLASSLEQVRMQFLLEELVCHPLVDQYFRPR